MALMIIRVLIKCQQPTKNPATLRSELTSFEGKWVKWESESLKLPKALDCQAAYFYILVKT